MMLGARQSLSLPPSQVTSGINPANPVLTSARRQQATLKPKDATNTLECALAMIETMDRWNAERRRSGEPEIKAGIGIHFGEAVLGDIGANRLEFAVIGTSVNVSSRLEALTRTHGVRMVMSDALLQQVMVEIGQAGTLFDGLVKRENQEIRGIAEPMTVWSKA